MSINIHSIEEWIKKMWIYMYIYIYTHTHTHTHPHTYIKEYFSAIKKDEIMPSAATRMDLESVILSESEEEKYHITSFICGIQKEMIQKNLVTKQKDSQT